MYKEVFAERLKKAREKTGLTQVEVEKETKISRVNLGRYETGAREPDIETIGKLAVFYGITTDWLMGIGRPAKEEEAKKMHQEMRTRKKILKELG